MLRIISPIITAAKIFARRACPLETDNTIPNVTDAYRRNAIETRNHEVLRKASEGLALCHRILTEIDALMSSERSKAFSDRLDLIESARTELDELWVDGRGAATKRVSPFSKTAERRRAMAG